MSALQSFHSDYSLGLTAVGRDFENTLLPLTEEYVAVRTPACAKHVVGFANCYRCSAGDGNFLELSFGCGIEAQPAAIWRKEWSIRIYPGSLNRPSLHISHGAQVELLVGGVHHASTIRGNGNDLPATTVERLSFRKCKWKSCNGRR